MPSRQIRFSRGKQPNIEKDEFIEENFARNCWAIFLSDISIMDLISLLVFLWIGAATMIFLFGNEIWDYVSNIYHSVPSVGTNDTAQQQATLQPPPPRSDVDRQFYLPKSQLLGSSESRRSSSHAPGSESCSWLNEFIEWLFRYYDSKPEFVDAWLLALNISAKKVSETLGCDVVFEQLCSSEVQPPVLSSVRSETSETREQMTLRAHIHLPLVTLRLVSSRRTLDRLLVSNFDARIANLSGEILARVACITNELFVMVCFENTPLMDMRLISHNDMVDPRYTQIVEEAIRRCITAAVTNLSLAAVTLRAGQTSGQPIDHVIKRLSASNIAQHASGQQLSEQSDATPGEAEMKPAGEPEHLVVRIIRAQRLGGGDLVSQPYVTLELDEPSQKFQTSLGINVSPYYDEEFTLELNSKSEEILFEVYDKRPPENVFLGLAIVGIHELRRASTLSHILTLQSRPYKNDRVSGTFCFIDLKNNKGRPGSASDSTTSAQRNQGETVKMRTKPSGTIESNSHPVFEPKMSQPAPIVSLPDGSVLANVQIDPVDSRSSRAKEKRNSASHFFEDVKRRLAPAASSASSASPPLSPTRAGKLTVPDSGRGRQIQSTPPSREGSRTRRRSSGSAKLRKSSSRASSFASEVSAASMYQHSTLVVEVSDKGLKRHYLVSPGLKKTDTVRRLLRRGSKLHIYNEHTFIAQRTPENSKCAVCDEYMMRSFRKSAYKCRDCAVTTHKRCHYKMEDKCRASTVSSMQIEYACDGSTDSRKRT